MKLLNCRFRNACLIKCDSGICIIATRAMIDLVASFHENVHVILPLIASIIFFQSKHQLYKVLYTFHYSGFPLIDTRIESLPLTLTINWSCIIKRDLKYTSQEFIECRYIEIYLELQILH